VGGVEIGGTNPKKVAGGAAGDTAGERRRVADEKKFMFLTVSSLPCHKQTTPTYTHTQSNSLTQADDSLLIVKKSNSSQTKTNLNRCAKGSDGDDDAQKRAMKQSEKMRVSCHTTKVSL